MKQVLPYGLGDGLMDRWTNDAWMNEWKNNVALPHPYHMGKSYNKFG